MTDQHLQAAMKEFEESFNHEESVLTHEPCEYLLGNTDGRCNCQIGEIKKWLTKTLKHYGDMRVREEVRISKDGNMWCVLLGSNLQDGICGFGKDIPEALEAFLQDFIKRFDSVGLKPEAMITLYDNLQEEYGQVFDDLIKPNRKEVLDRYYKLKSLSPKVNK